MKNKKNGVVVKNGELPMVLAALNKLVSAVAVNVTTAASYPDKSFL